MGQRPGAGDCRARGDPGRTRRTGRRALPPPPRPGARAAVTSRATRQPLAPPGRARAAAEHMGPRAGRAGGDRVEEEQSGAASKDGHPYLPEPPSGFSLGKDVGGPGDPWDKAGSTLQIWLHLGSKCFSSEKMHLYSAPQDFPEGKIGYLRRMRGPLALLMEVRPLA
ncbi:uncharacterized protein LOC107142918 isoform X3 [Marmota marmota marmota]|uniref:uncharacterized protein LOC107142918 isoform X3 n=1 Tax=Marmota marmota marmota TaxID=9994 RepID=UPI002093FB66|nr:uncharacterized protein LOC107142918 isoform X3 [Marmota marmota marmota]